MEDFLERIMLQCKAAADDVEMICWPEGKLPTIVRDGEDATRVSFFGCQTAGIASRIGYSPRDEKPTKECWAVVAVRSGLPAVVIVGPYDGVWYPIQPTEFPWLLASTAGGIRRSMEDGEALVFKRAKDKKLYGNVRDMNIPPTDSEGRI